MTFDIHAAIADLDSRGHGYSDNDRSRTTMQLAIERCPELAEPLRRCLTQLEDVQEYGQPEQLTEERKQAQEDAKHLYDLVDELEDRCAQMRDMVLILLKMDAAAGIKGELVDLANKLDDAREYGARHKELIEGDYA